MTTFLHLGKQLSKEEQKKITGGSLNPDESFSCASVDESCLTIPCCTNHDNPIKCGLDHVCHFI